MILDGTESSAPCSRCEDHIASYEAAQPPRIDTLI